MSHSPNDPHSCDEIKHFAEWQNQFAGNDLVKSSSILPNIRASTNREVHKVVIVENDRRQRFVFEEDKLSTAIHLPEVINNMEVLFVDDATLLAAVKIPRPEEKIVATDDTLLDLIPPQTIDFPNITIIEKDGKRELRILKNDYHTRREWICVELDTSQPIRQLDDSVFCIDVAWRWETDHLIKKKWYEFFKQQQYFTNRHFSNVGSILWSAGSDLLHEFINRYEINKDNVSIGNETVLLRAPLDKAIREAEYARLAMRQIC